MTGGASTTTRTGVSDRDLLLEILDRMDRDEARHAAAQRTERGLLGKLDPEPDTLVRFHLVMMVVWTALVLPTLLLWRESILWVAFMSLYANFVGHFGGWDAARAESAAR